MDDFMIGDIVAPEWLSEEYDKYVVTDVDSTYIRIMDMAGNSVPGDFDKSEWTILERPKRTGGKGRRIVYEFQDWR